MSPSCTRRPLGEGAGDQAATLQGDALPRRTASSSRFESLISSPCCGSATPARWHQSAQDSVERSVGQATISLGVRGRRPPLKSGAATISNSSSNRRSRPTLPSRPCRCVRRGRPGPGAGSARQDWRPAARDSADGARESAARQQPVQAEGRHHRDHQLTLPWTRPHHPRGVGDLARAYLQGVEPAVLAQAQAAPLADEQGQAEEVFQQLDLLADR